MVKLNVKLLRRVQKYILKNPEEFRMEDWSTKSRCVTTHCIGGTMVMLDRRIDGPTLHKLAAKESLYYVARDLLWSGFGITSSDIFYAYRWPKKIGDRYTELITPVLKAELASKAIDWFIKKYGPKEKMSTKKHVSKETRT